MNSKIKHMRMFVPLLLISSLVACQSVNSGIRVDEIKAEARTGQTQSAEEKKENDKINNKVEGYENKLFDTSYVHTIDIEISEEDWKDLLANPLEKTKYKVNATIDGEKIEDISFATKGNTSLSSVAGDSESDRYSFKLNFGKYVDGQTYYGLDKLNLNNIYADATYMKDYMSYEIFKAAGVEVPLASYVSISINGKNFGLYLALEEVGESYLERNDLEEAELYKPETEALNNAGNMPKGFEDGMRPEMPKGIEALKKSADEEEMRADAKAKETKLPEDGKPLQMPEKPKKLQDMNDLKFDPTEGGDPPKELDGKGKGMPSFGESNKGASLCYTDDNIDSYSDIFDNAETKVTDEDKKRVIESLKSLSEKKDLDSVVDTDSVIKYFVAHNFVLNGDSYTGNMLHNYYLVDNNGKLSMLPWDYNLAFGTFMGQGRERDNSKDNTTEIINTAIDTPLGRTNEEDRPMWAWIVSDETYLEKYHDTFNKLITNYFDSGECEKEIERVHQMILPYVEEDPSAFYSVDEFNKGYEALKTYCKLRAESIRKQLNGELSASSNEQNAEDFIDASSLELSDMGTQGMKDERKKSQSEK